MRTMKCTRITLSGRLHLRWNFSEISAEPFSILAVIWQSSMFPTYKILCYTAAKSLKFTNSLNFKSKIMVIIKMMKVVMIMTF